MDLSNFGLDDVYSTSVSTKNDILPQELQNASDVAVKLPARIRRVSDNYNHLHEQPTLFYALAIGLAVMGTVESTQILLAWSIGSRLSTRSYSVRIIR